MDNDSVEPETLEKKRGRKKRTEIPVTPSKENIRVVFEEKEDIAGEERVVEEQVVKKRGRKPKGGKLIIKPDENTEKTNHIVNVILHLKCSLSDLNDYNSKLNKLVTNPLEYNPMIPPTILSYNKPNYSQFSIFNEETNNEYESNEKRGQSDVYVKPATTDSVMSYAYKEALLCAEANNNNPTGCCICGGNKGNTNTSFIDTGFTVKNEDADDDASINIKDINAKLKKLKINLYKNQNIDKKSACFWCTYEYDNPTCYIPKYEMDDKLYGYGSFCRPECAVAYLMKENIDDSTKFERYHLLNQIYSKVYNFKKNIKPAPNPYFLLDKFYGNLTIQEYRKLLKTEHMLLVIDKPLTRILPELHEDNEDIMSSMNGGTSGGMMAKTSSTNSLNTTGVYKVKKQTDKPAGPSKSSIMRDRFGMA